MKRIIVCCDGTWNTPDQKDRGVIRPSNVVKTARAVLPTADDGTVQSVFYDLGVGTGPGLDKWTGGAFGQGLGRNITDAYRYIIHNYQFGDELFLFGFSRGAYTVRSTTGLIHNVGILRKEHSYLISDAFKLYKSRTEKPSSDYSVEFRHNYSYPERTIKFIGVWDTVGALGIPVRGLRWLTRKKHQFHDVELSSSIQNAYHAVAIDEKRSPFRPTLWKTQVYTNQQVEQVWFAGVHTNIGGGYEDSGLSDITLKWMLERASACGLAIDWEHPRMIDNPDNYAGELRNSKTGLYFITKSYIRPIRKVMQANESVCETAITRHRDVKLGYNPKNLVNYLRLKVP